MGITSTGYDEVHGGSDFGNRKGGISFLDFAKDFDLVTRVRKITNSLESVIKI